MKKDIVVELLGIIGIGGTGTRDMLDEITNHGWFVSGDEILKDSPDHGIKVYEHHVKMRVHCIDDETWERLDAFKKEHHLRYTLTYDSGNSFAFRVEELGRRTSFHCPACDGTVYHSHVSNSYFCKDHGKLKATTVNLIGGTSFEL